MTILLLWSHTYKKNIRLLPKLFIMLINVLLTEAELFAIRYVITLSLAQVATKAKTWIRVEEWLIGKV